MLLYQTLLDTKPSLTKNRFVELVLRWNKGSPHREIIVPGISLDGSLRGRYGKEGHWIDIEEYGDIIAIRLELSGKDGSLWDSDFVLNCAERKLAIQLDRSYREGAQSYDERFSTPHILSMLIDEEYLERDDTMPVQYQPHFIRESNLLQIMNVINGKFKCKLPVVYVSKTYCNTDPLNIWELSGRLKGIAHVLVQKSNRTNKEIREATSYWNEYYGAIGVYFPEPSYAHKRFLHRQYPGSEKTLLEKVVRAVTQYAVAQNIGKPYTWQGISNSVLLERLDANRKKRIEAETAQREAENETAELYDSLDEELKELQKKVEELTKSNEALMSENNGLRSKLSSMDALPLLTYGNEEDFYEGEIKDLVLAALVEYMPSCRERSRRADVLEDIIQCNGYMAYGKKKEEYLKSVLRGYKSLTGATKQVLEEVGLTNTGNNKHSKFLYYGDERYAVNLAKTPSDIRSGMNIAKEISALLF